MQGGLGDQADPRTRALGRMRPAEDREIGFDPGGVAGVAGRHLIRDQGFGQDFKEQRLDSAVAQTGNEVGVGSGQ